MHVHSTQHEAFHFHTLGELRRRIAELELPLEADDDIEPLLQPFRAGDVLLPNRLVVLPMEGCDGLADGSPDELTFRRYRRFAAGGAGLLWFEATAVVQEGRANPRQLWIHDGNIPAFRSLVEETLRTASQACGSRHRPLLVLQLTHSGRYSRPGRIPQPIIAHHSRFLDPGQGLPPEYPLISDDELDRLQDWYVEAAQYARHAGFDAVDVKACHRYLVSELLASHTREDSRYGGSFENRSRFLREVAARIRDRVPGLRVTSRMNVYDAMEYPYGFGVDPMDTSKPDLLEPLQLVHFFRDLGAPFINLTVGNPYFNPHVNRPFDLPAAGAPVPPESPLAGVTRFVDIVRRIQVQVPELAVIGGGYSWLRQFFPHVAAACVRRGWVSLVGAGRMAFAYPDFPRDLATQQRLDAEKVCVACSACTQIMRDGGRTGCVPRDAAIYEPIYKTGRAEAMDTILEMAKTCRQCNDPGCVARCPAQVNIPGFVGHIAARNFRAAYEVLREANVLALVCGYVCPAEILCESGCINEHYSHTVPIRHLQRWISRKAVEEGWAAEPRPQRPSSGRRVAVIGAGPAGISAAAALAPMGHSVTLFYGGSQPGGLVRTTIPATRLPDSILRDEVRAVLASSGVVVHHSHTRLGPQRTLDDVMAEGFDAVLIAVGLSDSMPLVDASRHTTGVMGALKFLACVKTGMHVRGTVLVLGGGNTAVDAALSALQAGAADVSIVYRRSFVEMPAWPEERDQAIRAGVHFLILTQPTGYEMGADGRLIGLRVVRTRLGTSRTNGRRAPLPIPGSAHILPADLVVEAIGQRVPDDVRQALHGVRFTERGLIWTENGSSQTTRAGVFAAGDIVNGGATVVQAVAEGARAARAIDAYLMS